MPDVTFPYRWDSDICGMLRLQAILLIAVLTTPLVYNVGVLADYYVKYDYYAKVLCENKAQPELHCNGQCHLISELDPVNDEREPLMPRLRMLSIEARVPESEAVVRRQLVETSETRYPAEEYALSSGYLFTVDPPPWSCL